MALVGARTAFHATIQEDAKAPPFIQQLAKAPHGLVLPAVFQAARKAELALQRLVGTMRLDSRHGARLEALRDFHVACALMS